MLRSLETGGNLLPFGGVGTGLVELSGCCSDAFNGRDWKRWIIEMLGTKRLKASMRYAQCKEGTFRLCYLSAIEF